MLLEVTLAAMAAAATDPCPGRGTSLYVSAAHRTLWLCEAGRQKEGLRVALGQGGVGKRREGDAKLPLGEYALGSPVPSKDFHLFIPVGYPTAQGGLDVALRRRGWDTLSPRAHDSIH